MLCPLLIKNSTALGKVKDQKINRIFFLYCEQAWNISLTIKRSLVIGSALSLSPFSLLTIVATENLLGMFYKNRSTFHKKKAKPS